MLSATGKHQFFTQRYSGPASTEPDDEGFRLVRTRTELRRLGFYPTRGLGARRRASWRRHPLGLPVVEGQIQYPPKAKVKS